MQECVELPDEFALVWQFWMQARGVDSLTWSELRAWSLMTKREISGHEAELIMRIDSICRRVLNER